MNCECNNCGGLDDVSIVGGRVAAGSVIAWGGRIIWAETGEDINWHSDAEARIKNILWNHGGFSQVNAGNMGSYWSPYISIVVRTQVDFAYLGDIFNTIEGAIWQAGFKPQVVDFHVQSVPTGTSTSPQTTQPGRAGGVYVPPGSTAGDGINQGSSPWNWPSFNLPSFGSSSGGSSSGNPIDTLANWLGVSPTQAALIGAGGALLAVIALKRVL